jgi:uncharacterized membrane protein
MTDATPLSDGEEASDRAGDNSLGRLLTLSDGVFAIAMTLLALDLRVPDLNHPTDAALRHALAQNASNYLSFLISFYVVSGYWGRHRRLMRTVETVDTAVMSQTLFLLLCVAAMPFPAALLGQYGSRAISLVIYGGLNCVAVLTLLRLHNTVRRHHVALTAEHDDDIPQLIGSLVVFMLCIPAGYVIPGNGAWTLLLLGVVPRGRWLWRTVQGRRSKPSKGVTSR